LAADVHRYTYTKIACAKLYVHKTPITVADLPNDRVLGNFAAKRRFGVRQDIRLDQPQPPLGSRLRALRRNHAAFVRLAMGPHHAQAAFCKRLVMTPNFPDGSYGA
jgi:hypothetical protein